ncbi:hypothetical protein Nhal_1822 [Nitrosococcus halophilus Nc 4]|uniref:Uncharacterized protein n=1 Tax=Nitrosococcus halophilus (strain Nc4) TaxID=472759 RepID=D5C351_NITHN|nr:hypothetical protein [Nitrosococcus halophilus]ADE14943.1 hypothetical protein Nhal_1822 [Nitrosococcus halophilus Nc 4]
MGLLTSTSPFKEEDSLVRTPMPERDVSEKHLTSTLPPLKARQEEMCNNSTTNKEHCTRTEPPYIPSLKEGALGGGLVNKNTPFTTPW